MSRYAEAFKGKVVLILTRSDANLTDGVVNHLKRERVDLLPYTQLLDEERRVRTLKNRRAEQVATRQNKMFDQKQMKKMSANKQAKMMDELKQYKEELDLYEAQIPELSMKRFSTLVQARNLHVIRRTQEERRDHMPEGMELKVFAVSNLHYAALTGHGDIDGDLMDADTTGIPALREMVRSMVAPTLLQRVEDFIEHRATVFLEGLSLWARSIAVENPEDIMALVSSPQEEAKPLIDSYIESIIGFAEKSIIKPLEKKQDKLSEHALSVLEKKAEWHWSTFRAFVRNYGNYHTSTQPQQSWNEQFLETATKITSIEWDTFVELQKLELIKVKNKLVLLVSGIQDALQGNMPNKTYYDDPADRVSGHPSAIVLPMAHIESMFSTHIEGIEQAAKEHWKACKKGLRNLKLDATQDRSTGFFTVGMKPGYDHARAYSGTPLSYPFTTVQANSQLLI